MTGQEMKQTAETSGFYKWQIAQEMGVCGATLVNLFRKSEITPAYEVMFTDALERLRDKNCAKVMGTIFRDGFDENIKSDETESDSPQAFANETISKTPRVVTLRECAKETGLSYYALRRMCLTEETACIRIGSKWLINLDLLIEKLNGRRNR